MATKFTLSTILFLLAVTLFAQSSATDSTLVDSIPTIPTDYDTLSRLPSGYDTLLSNRAWEELDSGSRRGYLLRFDPYGAFEEDAGDRRKYRYLKGRWEMDSTNLVLTFAVDRFLGEGMIDRRFRGRDGDYYVPFQLLFLDADYLIIADPESGLPRHYAARDQSRMDDPAQRNVPKGPPVKFELPKGW